jgi:phosphoglycolate phosphatase
LLLEELPSLQRLHPEGGIRTIYDEAIHAFRRARKSALRLYPGVREALEHARDAGALLVGYTESMAFYTADRMRRTGLDELLHYLYSAPDHDLPEGLGPQELRMYPDEHYLLKRTKHRHTPRGALKPNPELLLQIVKDLDADPRRVAYVGDSLMKDVAMAQQAGVADVWARYGVAHGQEEYELLRRVTHWTKEDVEREKKLTKADVRPTYTIEAFDEILPLFSFGLRATPEAPPVE